MHLHPKQVGSQKEGQAFRMKSQSRLRDVSTWVARAPSSGRTSAATRRERQTQSRDNGFVWISAIRFFLFHSYSILFYFPSGCRCSFLYLFVSTVMISFAFFFSGFFFCIFLLLFSAFIGFFYICFCNCASFQVVNFVCFLVGQQSLKLFHRLRRDPLGLLRNPQVWWTRFPDICDE